MPHTDIHTDVTTAVITNLAYLLVGVIILTEMDSSMLVVGSYAVAHCFLSGYHHMALTTGSRLADFGGMYAVGIALFLSGFSLSIPVQAGISLVATVALLLIVGVSRLIVGLVIALSTVMVVIKAGLLAGFVLIVIMGNALTWNYVADNALSAGHHSMVHGLPWHTQTALVILLAAGLISGTIVISL